jgi:hypothetical protein
MPRGYRAAATVGHKAENCQSWAFLAILLQNSKFLNRKSFEAVHNEHNYVIISL